MKTTKEQNLANLQFRLNDAKLALGCAVEMGNWGGVKKYAAQCERFERQLVKASGLGLARSLRQPCWMRSAGQVFGRGRLP